MAEQTIHVLVGLPGSGKTTFYGACKAFQGAVRISLDDLRQQCTGQDFVPGFEPWVKAWVDVTVPYLLAHGQSVVLDATNISRAIREKSVRDAKAAGVHAVCWLIDVPNIEAWRRNAERERFVGEDVFEGMAERFERPSAEEGFDSMYRVISVDGTWKVEGLR